mmetsp:Transcript_5977/g.22621  ORF Transcript_5977/g.22621 Transcript_5977/m.22621 type:complete len:203 (+) Transcript_5977:108-716(+)
MYAPCFWSPSEMYGTLATLSNANPHGFNTVSKIAFTPVSQFPFGSRPSFCFGTRWFCPSSTNGRNGTTTANTKTPPSSFKSARSSFRSINGVSHRSSTFRRHTQSNPRNSSAQTTPAAIVASVTVVTSVLSITTSIFFCLSLFTIGAEASVATTTSNSPPFRNVSVTSPSPAPTSRRSFLVFWGRFFGFSGPPSSMANKSRT